MDRKNIAVVFGGVSSEHSISLMSATTFIENLDQSKYHLYLIGITEKGNFLYYTGDPSKIRTGEWEQGPVCDCVISPSRQHHGMLLLKESGCEIVPLDCIIPVLHGKNGEDGTIQGLFQLAGIPFVGCDAISSAMCMDKQITHIVLEHAGVKMAKWLSVRQGEIPGDVVQQVETNLGYPVFVKPANAGSSYGVSKASNQTELADSLKLAFEYDKKVIVEETIVGREVECAVLGNADAAASAAGEIEPANGFYDFEAKYVSADSLLHIPARLKPEVAERLRSTAVKAYRAIGCEGLSRVDFFVTVDGQVILNEINTLPGFTSISMYPKLWAHGGVPIPQLLDRLIAYALER